MSTKMIYYFYHCKNSGQPERPQWINTKSRVTREHLLIWGKALKALLSSPDTLQAFDAGPLCPLQQKSLKTSKTELTLADSYSYIRALEKYEEHCMRNQSFLSSMR